MNTSPDQHGSGKAVLVRVVSIGLTPTKMRLSQIGLDYRQYSTMFRVCVESRE